MLRRAMLLPVLTLALAGAACDSPTAGNGGARVTVLLTDAPHEYLASAVVTIGRIEMVPVDGAPVLLTTSGGTWDLLQLQDGVTAALASVDIEPGRYSQLRMSVTDAAVTLRDGYTFTDGTTSRNLKVPSGAAAGIKVRLSNANGRRGGGVDVRPGETVLVVDFDVSQNFVLQGNASTPAGLHGFLFTPLLRAAVRDVAGTISGTVTAPEGIATAGLTVTATRTDAQEGDVPASTLVKEDGTFQLHFLPPGTYNVTVLNPPAGHGADTVQRTVNDAENVTGVQLVISPT